MSIDTTGMTRDKARATIRGRADVFADVLRAKGFDAQVLHSDSAAGPSSYVKISDPVTGRVIRKQVRFSNHSKGVFEAAGVIEIIDGHTEEVDVLRMAEEMRAHGPSDFFLAQQAAEKEQRQKTIRAGLARQAKGKSLTRTQEQLLKEEGLV